MMEVIKITNGLSGLEIVVMHRPHPLKRLLGDHCETRTYRGSNMDWIDQSTKKSPSEEVSDFLRDAHETYMKQE